MGSDASTCYLQKVAATAVSLREEVTQTQYQPTTLKVREGWSTTTQTQWQDYLARPMKHPGLWWEFTSLNYWTQEQLSSAITDAFCHQYGLYIHPLGNLVKIEGTGEFEVPYIGYAEVNIYIPQLLVNS